MPIAPMRRAGRPKSTACVVRADTSRTCTGSSNAAAGRCSPDGDSAGAPSAQSRAATSAVNTAGSRYGIQSSRSSCPAGAVGKWADKKRNRSVVYGGSRMPPALQRASRQFVGIAWSGSNQPTMSKQRPPLARKESSEHRPPWRTLVRHALQAAGGEAQLQAIYASLEARAPQEWLTPTWKAKVRQQLQFDPSIVRTGAGAWKLTFVSE